MRMSDCLHSMALTQEISQTYIAVLNFKLFYNHSYLSPLSLKYQPEASLVNLRIQLQIAPFHLDIRVEFPVLSNAFQLKFKVSLRLLT